MAEENIDLREGRKDMILSDEPKINLDGPDGLQYYWHDLRKEEEVFSKRNFGGRSVTVLGAFPFQGKCDLAILNGSQDSEKYCRTLEHYPFSSSQMFHNGNFIFQHDNASIYSSQKTKAWFDFIDVDVMIRPTLSSDLNPIENAWGVHARKVYAIGWQFENTEDLIKCIKICRNNIKQNLLKLVYLMKKKCRELFKARGAKIEY